MLHLKSGSDLEYRAKKLSFLLAIHAHNVHKGIHVSQVGTRFALEGEPSTNCTSQ